MSYLLLLVVGFAPQHRQTFTGCHISHLGKLLSEKAMNGNSEGDRRELLVFLSLSTASWKFSLFFSRRQFLSLLGSISPEEKQRGFEGFSSSGFLLTALAFPPHFRHFLRQQLFATQLISNKHNEQTVASRTSIRLNQTGAHKTEHWCADTST